MCRTEPLVWPLYPKMLSCWVVQYLARVAASETIKSFGNEAFNNGDYLVASRKYTKVRGLQKLILIMIFIYNV